jgi:tripartite-type tricarboxylate transporter receptor subunit TctC
MSIRKSCKRRAETAPIVSKIRRTQRRAVESSHGHPFRVNTANLPRRRFLHLAAGTAVLPSVSRVAWAQTYPLRPITLIVSYPAGGTIDTPARIIAERMQVSLGQSVIIENVSGASGTIGIGRAARAAGDGYTIATGGIATHVLNGALYPLQYDVVKDIEPISLTWPVLIVAKKSMPAKDLKGLIEWLKANPDKASAGDSGGGSPGRIFGIFFQKETGARFQILPYRGANLAMQDLVAGQIDLMIADPTNSIPQVRSGSIQAYAVAAKSRLAIAPDPDGRRGRIARVLRFNLDWAFCAQEHTKGRDRQAQRRRRRRLGRSLSTFPPR